MEWSEIFVHQNNIWLSYTSCFIQWPTFCCIFYCESPPASILMMISHVRGIIGAVLSRRWLIPHPWEMSLVISVELLLVFAWLYLAGVGKFRANARFHPIDVGWNLALTRNSPIPAFSIVKSCYSPILWNIYIIHFTSQSWVLAAWYHTRGICM